MKKQKGYALVMTLMLVFIISLIISTVFFTGIVEYRTSNNNVANTLAFQSAENSIQKSLTNLQVSKVEVNKILNISNEEKKLYCINDNGEFIAELCDDVYLNKEKTIKSKSEVSRRLGECEALGSSDQLSGCFNIQGIGQIPSIDLELSNIQEIKINTINASNNGVYEY